jgi:hypothetical protein
LIDISFVCCRGGGGGDGDGEGETDTIYTYRTTFAPSSRSEKKIQSSLGGFFFFTDVLGGWAGGDNDVYILYFTKPDASVACMAATLLSPDINSITSDRGGPKTDLMYPRILVSPSYTWTYNAAFFLSPGPCRVIIFTEEIIIPRHRLMLTSSL